ncbi:GRIP and coiled-coil domain-containing protein 2-like isoform X1 [Poecilia reticulata]|uniref:GRIP and coiled-coil domain-containing protein 2-like isoform X1 n=1 Tax=Poecilia reticulata TaxID=8081 RepID=UPI0004A3E3C0|nr:PREDICTED: GRIP and coiled-coil domain-containing protein 2-like isoform X1 [Poecilia reticulata]XP_008433528.1 PREDICTED: GRIP and coiled-coil domain-containing protein 2-like isoform X1 [Poecilia reticulata]
MSHQRPLYTNSAIRRRWGAVSNHQDWFEAQRLRSLVETARARRMEENQKVVSLQRELDNMKYELQKEKNLKDMYIKKGKEMKRELLAVEKFTNPEALNPAIIASQVHSDIKRKSKRLLQQDLEQLKVAHIVKEEEFMSQIQAEKKKSDTLQQELDEIKARYEKLQSKYEADIREEKLQVNTDMFYEEKLKQDQKLFENLREEKNNLQEQMSKEIACLQETERCLQSQLEQITVSFQELSLRYEEDVSGLRQKAEGYQLEMNHEKEAHLEREKKDLQLIKELRAEKDNLSQKMGQEFSSLQQSKEARKHLQSELEQIKVSYQELKIRYKEELSALREQDPIYQQGTEKEMEAYLQKIMSNLKIINELGAEKDDLQKFLADFQQMYCGCEIDYKTELEHLKTELQERDELGPPKRKVAKRQEPNEKDAAPVNNISDPASKDLVRLFEETPSEDIEVPDASPEELNHFIETMTGASAKSFGWGKKELTHFESQETTKMGETPGDY